MTGTYRIALFPSADEQAFVQHMTEAVFRDPGALQLTRITRHIGHQLWKAQGPLRQYAWQATVDLQTDAGYDFDQNAERVQKSVEGFGLLIGIDSYTGVGP